MNQFKQFILVTNRDNPVTDNKGYHFTKLAVFEGAVIDGEDYYIYSVHKQ